MKKVLFVLAVTFSLFMVVAVACPRGEHPYGGTGPHHKGGYCA